MSDYSAVPFPDELVHLEQVGARLSDILQQMEVSTRRADRKYADTKRYMADHGGGINPHEMFQNELLLRQTDRTGVFAMEIRDQTVKLEDSSYFTRVDFKGEQGEGGQPYYIGRFALQYENEPLVFNWHMPISGVSYDCEVGAARFMVPAGRTVGEFTRKRQFKIRNGATEYTLESSASVWDDILRKRLSYTSDEKMKSIISTVQREQGQIIRNEKERIVIIQGVVGSGKTSTALHRVVFLLHRLEDRLTARNVMTLLPNKVLGDYISDMIPELDRGPIYEMGSGELVEIQLEGVIDFEPDRDPFETRDGTWNEGIWSKSILDFVPLMGQYIERLPEFIFIPTDYVYGNSSVKGGWIRNRSLAYGTCPARKRLAMVADDIHGRFETDSIMEQKAPRPRAVLKQSNSMPTMKDMPVVCGDLYKRVGIPEYFVMAARKTLEWMDVYPFLYPHSAFRELKESHITRHLVIDEVQNYTPVQYAALDRIFPCRKIILGGFGQSVNPNHLRGLEGLRAIYDRAQSVELDKSYRSTYETTRFAKKIHHVSTLEPVERCGKPPALIPCLNAADEIRKIREAIRCFRARKSVSLGIILKTDAAAKDIYEVLAGYDGVEENQVEENQVEGSGGEACDVNLLTRESISF